VESSEYKHVVLSLIFLKFISDKFEERKNELMAEGKADYVDMVEFYTMKNVFYLPEESRWSFIQKQAKQDDIAVKIDTALHSVEKNNKSLRGALPDNYFSRLGIDVSKLAALIDSINNIDTVEDKEEDVVGRVYEYFLGMFAATEGKGGGEFYTPKCVVNLIAEMIEPYKGKIYDPCCGTGGALQPHQHALHRRYPCRGGGAQPAGSADRQRHPSPQQPRPGASADLLAPGA
jgi:type I restriction enzyme M protein